MLSVSFFLEEVRHQGRGPATLRQHTLEKQHPAIASLQRSPVSDPLGRLGQLAPPAIWTATASESQVRPAQPAEPFPGP